MLFKSLALVAAPLAAAQELMRFGCGQLTIDRIDPLVNPGQLPSQHMHQVVGGNSFNATMDPKVRSSRNVFGWLRFHVCKGETRKSSSLPLFTR